MKKISFVLGMLLCLIFVSCTPGEQPPENTDKKVMVTETEGLTVESQNPVTVKSGADAVFNITIANDYIVRSVSAGTYDRAKGKLTIKDVKTDLRVQFELEKVDYDTTQKYKFYFITEGADDESSVAPIKEYYAGTEITVRANDDTRMFLGWSFGMQMTYGAEPASTSREYTFRLTPDIADAAGDVMLYANYSDTVEYSYNLNGAEVNTQSPNFSGGEYYSTSLDSDILTVSLKSSYFEKASAASLFYDDGIFSKEGYILKEYNTEPDGSGESFSLGSKFHIDRLGTAPTLYCIWESETPSADFEVRDFEYSMPSGTSLTKAPHWEKYGVMITNYLGNDTTVVIPEKIGGKYVTAIAEGAFRNKDIETLVMGRRILKIEDGAFVGCRGLTTVYYPDGIYSISDAWLDAASYTSLKNLYVNATIAPRFTATTEGGFAYKLMKLLRTEEENRIIVIAGSSSYQGLATKYLEALIGSYSVINFGTTRTTNGLLYLEAISAYAHDGDLVLVSPENSIYMMGENTLYYKTLRDIEGMYNLFRNIDISNYDNVFGAFADFNQNYRYGRNGSRYEQIVEVSDMNTDGDCIKADREFYRSESTKSYTDSYTVTMNDMVKSALESDWRDPNDNNWCSFTASEYSEAMNAAFDKIKSSGAGVYFAFAPTDEHSLSQSAKSETWLLAYDRLILDTYTSLDGIVGSSLNYVFNHEYFYDCAFHPNDYGRVYRTYRLYLDLAEILGIENTLGILDVGTSYEGCLFEPDSTGEPKFGLGFVNP